MDVNTTKEFERALRYQLREAARSSYGKPMKELSKKEMKILVERILEWNFSMWKLGRYGSRDEYKMLFKRVFKKELKLIK